MQERLLAVSGCTHRKGVLHLTLVLPDGTRSLIPAAWTDLPARIGEGHLSASPRTHPTSLGSIRHLLHARRVVDALLGRLDPAEPAGTDTQQQETHHATTTDILAGQGPSTPGRRTWESLGEHERDALVVALAKLIGKDVQPASGEPDAEDNHER